MNDATRAIDRLIATHFDGDATRALLAVAQHADIAVAWMDQRWIARELHKLGVTLTAELWDKVRTQLGGFDAYACDPGTSVHTDYLADILRELGVKNDAGEDLDL